MTDKMVGLVTCRDRREAQRIARRLVGERLAACVNILSAPVQSVYLWKGKMERAQEILLVVKTTRRLFQRMERRVRELHSYDVPEVIGLAISRGSRAYLRWMEEAVAIRR